MRRTLKLVFWKFLGILVIIIGLIAMPVPIIPGFPIVVGGLFILIGKERSLKWYGGLKFWFKKLLKFKNSPD